MGMDPQTYMQQGTIYCSTCGNNACQFVGMNLLVCYVDC